MHKKQMIVLVVITVLVAVFFFAAYELGTSLGGKTHRPIHKSGIAVPVLNA